MLKHKKIALCILALVLVASLCVPAFASSFTANYSIPTGSSSAWSGKDSNLWKFTSTDSATFQTTRNGCIVTSTLWMVKVWAPDQSIISYRVTQSSSNGYFIPQTSNSYYAVVTPVSNVGVYGTVSAWN